jgi:hypothetical protein
MPDPLLLPLQALGVTMVPVREMRRREQMALFDKYKQHFRGWKYQNKKVMRVMPVLPQKVSAAEQQKNKHKWLRVSEGGGRCRDWQATSGCLC